MSTRSNICLNLFFTTKEVGKGTGLGLSTVYGIVKQHQGWISVSSAVDQGTTFEIFLPITHEAPEVVVEGPSDEPIASQEECVLVVEDEPALLEMVSTLLENYGYRILRASDGLEAMEVWKRHAGNIDLLITDMVMPRGLSGRELAEELRREQPDLKILYTSGYSVDIAGEDLVLSEGVNFIGKPYHPSALARTIRKCLDGDLEVHASK